MNQLYTTLLQWTTPQSGRRPRDEPATQPELTARRGTFLFLCPSQSDIPRTPAPSSRPVLPPWIPMLADPPTCPQCGRFDNLKLLGKLKDRAPFRGVARLYGYRCLCGVWFKHSVLNAACERVDEAGHQKRRTSSAA